MQSGISPLILDGLKVFGSTIFPPLFFLFIRWQGSGFLELTLRQEGKVVGDGDHGIASLPMGSGILSKA